MSQSRVLIERLDQLIPMKATGSAQDLSERPGISRITVCELIEFMKAMEAENEYCPHQSSFYYAEDKILAKGFVNKRKIGGGVIFLRLFCFVRFFRTNSKYLCPEAGSSSCRLIPKALGIFSKPLDRGDSFKNVNYVKFERF